MNLGNIPFARIPRRLYRGLLVSFPMTSTPEPDQDDLSPSPEPKPKSVVRGTRQRWITMRHLFAILALIAAGLWIADEVRLSLLDLDDAIAAVDAGTNLSAGSSLERRLAAPLRYWNYRTARRVLSRLTEEGDAAAPLMLGQIYCQARGVDHDGDAAQRLYAKSAERGFLPAFAALADTFAGPNAPVQTWCGPGDSEKAIYWRLKAAEHGHIDSLAEAGYMMLIDRSALMNQRGQNMLEEAWAAGSYHAAYRIALAGRLGQLDQPMEPAEQLKWYRTAALGGNPEAMKDMIHILSNVFPRSRPKRPVGPRLEGLEEALKWSLVGAVWWGETDESFLEAVPSMLLGYYPELWVDTWLLGTSDLGHPAVRRLRRLSIQERSDFLEAVHAQTLAWIGRIENGISLTEAERPYDVRQSRALVLEAIHGAEKAALEFLADNPAAPPISPAPPPAIIVPMDRDQDRDPSGLTRFG